MEPQLRRRMANRRLGAYGAVRMWLFLLAFCVFQVSTAAAAQPVIRVLFVGGDWKSQLPNYQGHIPLRGYFVREVVDKASPGEFQFTLWTSYEFLQYGDTETFKQFDVIVVGDVMGESITPRLAAGMEAFVKGGGGALFCDNHKAFSCETRERSFDAVMPVQFIPFRPFGPEPGEPALQMLSAPQGGAGPLLKVTVKEPNHPVFSGLDLADAPPLNGAHIVPPKAGATVLATTPAGAPLWVAGTTGAGRVLWTGGFFANDELSEQFAQWPKIGQLYVQIFRWLAEPAHYPRVDFSSAVASGTLTVDLTKPGPAISAKHFSIHGSYEAATGSDAEKKLYADLKLDGAFQRTDDAAIIKRAGDTFVDDGSDLRLDSIDWTKYDRKKLLAALDQIAAVHGDPIGLHWMPWPHQPMPDPKVYAKYYLAALLTANGQAGSNDYKPRMQYFEPGNEPNLTNTMQQYIDFLNYTAGVIHQKFPGVKVGCMGSYEWPYLFKVIDGAGKSIDWISRHPYGRTGESIMDSQDVYLNYAKSHGCPDLKCIITEWDFWIYGQPAFDYIMQRWKPLADRADTCLGSLQYRWTEYEEGGYVFGVVGKFNQRYGELPPEWPNPGIDKPITYRYNGYWIMRDCRGGQFATELKIPDLKGSASPRAYAIATATDKQYNIVVYAGAAYCSTSTEKRFDSLKLHIHSAIPSQVKGRTLVISRADDKDLSSSTVQIIGDAIDTDVELRACTAVSLTVR
jgi:uncharacterized membrane protein